MKKSSTVIGTACFALMLFGASACAPKGTEEVKKPVQSVANFVETEQAHIERAFALAGDDFMQMTAKLQCGNDRSAAMAFIRDNSIVPPTRIFDNLIYLGKPGVGAFALLTDEGIILIDTLNSTNDVKNVIEPGLRELGLDPASVKKVIITQGHGDHYGGAKYMADTYGSRIYMSDPDWNLVENLPEGSPFNDRSRFDVPPKRDLSLSDGQKVKLGSTEVTVVLTPGHSPATASLIFPVYDKGQRHMAGMWGGTGIPRDPEWIKHYIDSTRKFREISKQYGVDVEVNGHAFVDDGLRRMKQIRDNPDQANPFIIGEDRYHRYTKILEECANAALLRAKTSTVTK